MRISLFILFSIKCFLSEATNNVTIRGRIKHPISDSIQISFTPATINYYVIKTSAKLGADGTFESGLDLPAGYTQLTVVHGNQQTELFVQPGADLVLSADAANFDSSLHYDGLGNEVANYSAWCVLTKHTGRDINQAAQMLRDKDPAEYEASLKALLQRENDILESAQGVPGSFKDYLKTEHQYETWYAAQMYPRTHEAVKEKTMSVKNIPAENYAVIDYIPEQFNDAYLSIESYRSYLYNLYSVRMSAENAKTGKTMPENEYTDSIMERSFRQMPQGTAEFQIGRRLYNSIKRTPADLVTHEYEWYKAHFPGSKNTALIRAEIDRQKNTGPGKPEIDFEFTTAEGVKMKLSDLKGKVVYLDFWSRTCVPCLAELKDAEKVRAHYKDKAVVFVYVSLDDNESVWHKAIADFHVEGLNLHVDKGYESDLIKKYGIGGLPGHFLIDKEGKYARVDVVESASQYEKLVHQIDQLLE